MSHLLQTCSHDNFQKEKYSRVRLQKKEDRSEKSLLIYPCNHNQNFMFCFVKNKNALRIKAIKIFLSINDLKWLMPLIHWWLSWATKSFVTFPFMYPTLFKLVSLLFFGNSKHVSGPFHLLLPLPGIFSHSLHIST